MFTTGVWLACRRRFWLADMRVVTFIGLSLIFGLLFFQLDWTVDVAGVNSLNSYVPNGCCTRDFDNPGLCVCVTD